MQGWPLRQNSFTRWTAIGTAASAATGIVAVAALVTAFIAAFMLGQRTYFTSRLDQAQSAQAEAAGVTTFVIRYP